MDTNVKLNKNELGLLTALLASTKSETPDEMRVIVRLEVKLETAEAKLVRRAKKAEPKPVPAPTKKAS